MDWFVTSLRENPELAIFLTLALGFLIGRLRLGSFKLGNVVGTLLAGVVVGQLDIQVAPLVKIVFFDLFLFATGYKVGPQFFRGLGRTPAAAGGPHGRALRRQPGHDRRRRQTHGLRLRHRRGLLAGAFTESTVIGTAAT